MDGEVARTAENARELLHPIQRYNVSIQENSGRWDCYGIPVQPNRPSQRFPFVNAPDPLARELAGVSIGREIPKIPEYPIYLGTELPPHNIRALSFLGEYLSNEEMRSHLLRHEVGHAAIHRDLAAVLQRAIPGQEIGYLKTMMSIAEQSRTDSTIPLSQLYKIGVYNTPEKRFIEDLAEMYAIRAKSYMENPQLWKQYQQLVTHSNPNIESLFGIMEELFKESQKLSYT